MGLVYETIIIIVKFTINIFLQTLRLSVLSTFLNCCMFNIFKLPTIYYIYIIIIIIILRPFFHAGMGWTGCHGPSQFLFGVTALLDGSETASRSYFPYIYSIYIYINTHIYIHIYTYNIYTYIYTYNIYTYTYIYIYITIIVLRPPSHACMGRAGPRQHSVSPLITNSSHLLREVQCPEVSPHHSHPCLSWPSSSTGPFHFDCLALLHPPVISHTHHMPVPAQSPLLHTTLDSSYTHLFSQLICASPFMHAIITHPSEHTRFTSFQPSHILRIHCPCLAAM